MGGVEVLNARDCLRDTFSRQTLISPPSTKAPRNPNPNSNRVKRAQSNRRKRSPSRSNSVSPPSRAVASKASAKTIVMGQVKILKRGEELTQTASDKPSETESILGEPDLDSTERLVPGLTQQTESNIVIPGFYAGSSAFIASPPPSSLPLPAFFTKKIVVANTDDATSDLRRILRLDCLD